MLKGSFYEKNHYPFQIRAFSYGNDICPSFSGADLRCLRKTVCGFLHGRVHAREDSHIQELITSAGEILEGTDGTVQNFLALMPDGVADQDSICYYFDRHWQNTSEESAVYKMRLVCSASDKVKEVQVTFEKLQNANKETSLYTQTIRFPVFSTKEEADS